MKKFDFHKNFIIKFDAIWYPQNHNALLARNNFS